MNDASAARRIGFGPLLVALMALHWTAHCSRGQTPGDDVAAITHVTVVDTTTGRLKPDQTVIWKANRITAVGESDRTPPPTDARTIDGSGKYLIPGLWEMHAHVLWPGLDTFFPLFIANGITGVRDMGTHFPKPVVERWRRQVIGGARPGPRFVWVGPVMDGPQPIWPGSTAVANPLEARQAVRDRKEQGMQFVKVYERLNKESYLAVLDEAKKVGIPVVGHVPQSVTATEASDGGQRCIEHLSRELDACLVSEGLAMAPIVDSHPDETAAVREALLGAFSGKPDFERFAERSARNLQSADGKAWAGEFAAYGELQAIELLKREDADDGPTCLYRMRFSAKTEHFRLKLLAGRRIEFLDDLQTIDAEKANALADTFLRNGTWQCPTAVIDYAFNFQDQPEVADRTELKFLPQAIRDRVRLPLPFPGPEIGHRYFHNKMALLSVLRTKGVSILAGTDAPMSEVTPGFSLHEELRLLVVEAGFTPLAALQTATLNPARFLGREQELGTVNEGKLCDLVLLDANPLTDIRNTRRIAAVVADGKIYERRDLDKLLHETETAAAANQYNDRTAEELLKEASTSDQPEAGVHRRQP